MIHMRALPLSLPSFHWPHEPLPWRLAIPVIAGASAGLWAAILSGVL